MRNCFRENCQAIKEDLKNWVKQLEDILSELIGYYLIACDLEQNLKHFEQLALQSYYNADPDGFDALYELSEKYGPESDKGKIVILLTPIGQFNTGQNQRSEPCILQSNIPAIYHH